MIKEFVVDAVARSDTGKNACRRMRRAGQVPGIVYGLDLPAFPIAVEPRRIEEVLKLETGRNTIFKLRLQGEREKERSVMIREIQRDPVSEKMTHLDFVRLDLTKKIEVRVPVRLIGTPLGVKNEGGVVDFVQRVIELECLPSDIPDHVEVDVGELHINQHVAVSDIRLPGDVVLMTDPESIIAVVVPPRVEEVAEAPAEEEVAATEEAEEPEVIKKGKEAEAAEESESKGE